MMAKALVGGLAAHCGPAGPFLLAFTTVLLWWLVLYDLYRRKVFIRI
jgi:predicted acyltransferase